MFLGKVALYLRKISAVFSGQSLQMRFKYTFDGLFRWIEIATLKSRCLSGSIGCALQAWSSCFHAVGLVQLASQAGPLSWSTSYSAYFLMDHSVGGH